ncbi:MAG: hypothetical protein ACK4NN_09030 [Rheinheimera sp.]
MKSFNSILPSQTSNLQSLLEHCLLSVQECWCFYRDLAVSQWDFEDDR